MSLTKPIKNYYKFTKTKPAHNPKYREHLIDVPFRMVVIGGSGAGKTLFLCELIHRTSGTFEEIIICLRSKHEPLYELLEKKGKGQVVIHENKIPDIEEFKDSKQRMIVFDDLILDKKLQVRIGEYYIRSRKYNMSCVYISQSFYAIPKIIRQQANYIVLKKLGSDKDIKMIIREYSLGLSIDELMHLYKQCTKTKLEFLMLDLNNDKSKYRHCFAPVKIDDGNSSSDED